MKNALHKLEQTKTLLNCLCRGTVLLRMHCTYKYIFIYIYSSLHRFIYILLIYIFFKLSWRLYFIFNLCSMATNSMYSSVI